MIAAINKTKHMLIDVACANMYKPNISPAIKGNANKDIKIAGKTERTLFILDQR